MKYARAFEALSLALPLTLAQCSKNEESRPAGTAESNTAEYSPATAEMPASEPEPAMAPASGTTEQPTDTIPSPQAMNPETQTLTDAQIAAITDAANGAEVDQAKLALQKSKNARVKKFAQMMIDEHGKAQLDQAKLVSKLGIKPETDNPKVSSLKTDAADSERTLKAATADSFDRAYIDIQVADHQMVLDSLDRDFIPAAKNPEFKRALQDFRPKVEHHLQEAMDIQQSLSAAPKSGTNKNPPTK